MSKKNGFSKKALDEFREKFEKLEGQRKKHTSQAIERRRHDVWEMMCQDIPRAEMAKLLGVSRSLIMLDVKYWKSRVGKRTSRMKDDPKFANMEVGLITQKLDSVISAAFQEYSMAKSGNDKHKFLDMANKGLATKAKILMESGFLPKAGVEVKHTLEKIPSFAERLGQDHPLAEIDNPSTRHKLLDLAAQILREAENGIINVEAKVIDPQPPAAPGPAPESAPPA